MSSLVLDDVDPVARKTHRCTWCSRDIAAGEKYRRQRVVTDDGPDVWKSCAHCDRVFAAIWANDPDGRYYDEGVDLFEYLHEYCPVLCELFAAGWRARRGDEKPMPVGDVPVDEIVRLRQDTTRLNINKETS